MSDLAPLVAAVLESKIVAELKEELDQIKTETKSSKLCVENERISAAAMHAVDGGGMVEIMGRDGSVYVHGMFKDAEHINDIFMELRLIVHKDVECPITQIETCEIHVNGVRVAIMGDFDQFGHIYGVDTNIFYEQRRYLFEETKTRYEHIWRAFYVNIEYGPFHSAVDRTTHPNDLLEQ